jgi:hypothetical protein
MLIKRGPNGDGTPLLFNNRRAVFQTATGLPSVKGAFDEYKRTDIFLANNTVYPASTGSFIPGEIIYQGNSVATSDAQAIVYSYTPHSKVTVIRVQGTFGTGTLTGNTSSANRSAIATNTDTQVGNDIFEDINDNLRIQSEADGIIDFTENNPFGEF